MGPPLVPGLFGDFFLPFVEPLPANQAGLLAARQWRKCNDPAIRRDEQTEKI
jgi:hypothetical protein